MVPMVFSIIFVILFLLHVGFYILLRVGVSENCFKSHMGEKSVQFWWDVTFYLGYVCGVCSVHSKKVVMIPHEFHGFFLLSNFSHAGRFVSLFNASLVCATSH